MYIVFDIGGSKTRVATSTDKTTLASSVTFETQKDFSIGLEKLFQQINQLLGNSTPQAIVGGIAGLVEHDELTHSANLNDWTNQQLAQKLRAKYNCPVRIENDASLGALGESKFGAGQGFSSIAYLTLGTGIGGAWVVNQQLPHQSIRNFEPGHQIIDFTGKTDLEQNIKTAPTQKEKEHLLAIGIQNMLTFWPAEIVVLGGGQILHNDWSLEHLIQEVRSLLQVYKFDFELKRSTLGDHAGLFGALTLLE